MTVRLLAAGRNLEARSATDRARDRVNQSRKRQRGLYRKSLSRIKKIQGCLDLVTDWDDWLEFTWWVPAFRSLNPPPILSVSEWADMYRRIASEFSSESGDWRTDKMPCMKAIMDACSPNDPCKRVVVVKPSQSGGTEAAVLNMIGFTIDLNPRSMLVVFPTLELAEAFSRERLDPMIALCPTLKAKVSDVGIRGRANETASTVRRKKYPGGFANLVGANSTTGLSSRPVPIVIMDEVDRCLEKAGREGNPTQLAATRATTFFDRKEIYLSSPARQEEETGILQMYESSTLGELEVACPYCQTFQALDWDSFDLETASCACKACQRSFVQWQWQSTPQRWIERNPGHPDTRGFSIGWFVSPWVEWKTLATEWKEAVRMEQLGDNSLMRVFVNTRLAKAYKKMGKRIEQDLYATRRETYRCHEAGAGIELPEDVKIVTAAIDVQDSMLVYEIIGWGMGRESWGIEAGELQGDPRSQSGDVWKLADTFVYKRVLHWEDGTYTRPKLIFVDSGGHCTTEVYKYCKQRHPRAFSIKGKDGVVGTGMIVNTKRRESAVGNWLVRVGTDTLKEEFHSRMGVLKVGPGYCHFPMGEQGESVKGYDEEYFRQLVCEQRILKYDKGGFAQYEWTKNRTDANDYLMCRCYARAALEYLKIPLDTMKKDAVTSIPKDEVHTIEVGTGKRISIVEHQPKEKQEYGQARKATSTTGIQYVSNPGESRQETRQKGRRSFGAGGAAGRSF
jgi:phage terminase large subunit GpA-like protein